MIGLYAKRLVHKQFISEVFLTDYCQLSENTFLIAAFLPRTHSYYNDSLQSIDVSIILEIFRQCSILISHVFYNIPSDVKFVFDKADLHCANTDISFNFQIQADYQAIIDISVIETKMRNKNLSGLKLEMKLFIQSQLYATKTMHISFFQPKIWNRLRASAQKYESRNYCLHELSDYQTKLHKQHANNIVITDFINHASTFHSKIIPHTSHPVFFDHPLDHVPASLLLEAIRQHGLMIAFHKGIDIKKLYLWNISIEFKAFCELSFNNYCCSNEKDVTITPNCFTIQVDINSVDKICTSANLYFRRIT